MPETLQGLTPGVNVADQLTHGRQLRFSNVWEENLDGEGGSGSVNLEPYTLRMLAHVPRGSQMVVPRGVHAHAMDIVRYQKEMGVSNLEDSAVIAVERDPDMGLAQSILQDIDRVRGLVGGTLDGGLVLPFIMSENTEAIAAALGGRTETTWASAYPVNHKGTFLKGISQFGVQTPQNIECRSTDEMLKAYKKLIDAGHTNGLLVKADRSATGQCIEEVYSEEDLIAILEQERYRRILEMDGLSLQPIIRNVIASPNLLTFVGDRAEDHRLIGCSNQILVKTNPDEIVPSVHKGNLGPLRPAWYAKLPDLRRDLSHVMSWVQSTGFRGQAGFDILLHEKEDGSLGHVFIECNGRINGNSAATMMAHNLGARFYGANNGVHVPVGTSMSDFISHLESTGVHFDPSTRQGVLVLNPANNVSGKMQIGVYSNRSESHVADMMEAANME